ncbi:MAG: HDOD domain-containing protein [Candidatus Zixiibacteriota bacterium]|nr:MAG: HDOD domain-containing protein [candidate division Zixibacteria bacterium]
MTTTVAGLSVENKIDQLIGNIRNLPTPPIVFEQIQKVIQNPSTSVAHIAAIISEDPAMSVKVLKLTNSAFYGLSREVESIKHAIMIIGMEAVKNLVLSASVLNMFKADNSNKEFHEDFWRHSLAAAFASRLLAQKHQNGKIFNPDPAFTGGLIHDLGKMIICCFMPKEHQQIVRLLAETPGMLVVDAEEQVLGFDHAQLGRQLAKQWRLPTRTADSIGFHHRPGLENASDNYAYLIALSDHIAQLCFPSQDIDESHHKLADGVLDYFDINASKLEEFKVDLFEEYMKAQTFMQIAGTEQ